MRPYSVGMKCPCCDTPDAYMGLRVIYCTNDQCRFYDARYAGKTKSEKLTPAERLLLFGQAGAYNLSSP